MKRILLTIAYDGTNYRGWQKQQSLPLQTVEDKVEKALQALFQSTDLTYTYASRTDAGVHALGQRLALDVETTMPAERVPVAIRPFLPEDIMVVEAEEVSADFHPRYDCVKKTYEYSIWNGKMKNLKERLYSSFIKGELDIEKMQAGAAYLLGTHDFAAFCAAGSTVSSTVRTIFDCRVEREGDKVRIQVTGDGFLYHMVRIIVGTLIAVGLGKMPPQQVADIIESKDRRCAGPTAEPQGLTLLHIFYK